jgi:hypothetical protein
MKQLKKYLLLTAIFISYIYGTAQIVELLPSIGLSALPADSAAICYIQNVNSNNGGVPHVVPNVGDTIADFTLYDVNGIAYNMQEQLTDSGKHVLLVSGSFT